MQIHFLRKISIAIGNSLSKIFNRSNLPLIYRLSFLLGYIIVLILILVPQIDYQNWYPSYLGKYDFEPSQDFTSHKQLIINVEEENQISATCFIIDDRLSELRVNNYKKTIDGNTIIVDLPSSLDDRIIDLLTGIGNLSLGKRKESTSNDYSAESLYDSSNYEETGINFSKVTDAKIIEKAEGYTSIEITSEEEDKWNSITGMTNASTFALFVDDNLYLAQVVPVSKEIRKPRLVIFSNSLDVNIIVSQIQNTQLKTITSHSISNVNARYSTNFGGSILLTIVLSASIGLLYRYYILHDTNKSISTSVLIILGIVTVCKVIPVTWGIFELILLSSLILLMLTIKLNRIIGLSAILIILGIIFDQILGNYFTTSFKLVYVSGFCSLIIYLTLFFLGFNEEV